MDYVRNVPGINKPSQGRKKKKNADAHIGGKSIDWEAERKKSRSINPLNGCGY